MQIDRLPPREREIAEIVYDNGEASAAEIGRAVSDPLSNAAIRSMLRRLQAKGVVRRRKEGKKFFYAPAIVNEAEKRAALRRVAGEYFNGSLSEAAAAMIELSNAEHSPSPRLRAA